MLVVFCVPTYGKKYQAFIDSLEAAVPVIEAAGHDTRIVFEVNCPYISHARATLLRKALDVKPDCIVFLDQDVGFDPQSLLKLIETEGDYVAGTYRFKYEPEEYMGHLLSDQDGRPLIRESDGALYAYAVPAGFLKITPHCVNVMIEKYPELCYGARHTPHFDFFNHGAHNYTWIGEDYAASRRWIEAGQEIMIIPDLNLDHHTADAVYKGNFHQYLMRQEGGSEWNPSV